MKFTLLKLLSVGLALVGAGQSAWAQPTGQTNFFWTAVGDAMTWSRGTNWTSTWADNSVNPPVSYPGITGLVPPTDGTTYQINLYNAPGTASLIPVTITNTDVVTINDAVFGPMWGQTLNVYGQMNLGFGIFTWGAIGSAATTLNLYPNSSLSAVNTFGLGTAWWFAGGPNVVVNVYSNAFIGTSWMQFGGKLNLYGGTVSVTNTFNTGAVTTPVFSTGVDSDATRAINLTTGGTLVLPASYTSTVNDWISRGILLVYGVPSDAAEIVIDEANTNWPGRTVVTTTATNANPMLAVHLDLPRTNLSVGGLEQAQVYADYTITTNVNVTGASGINITYRSSATNVLTITSAGLLRALGAGTASVSAIIGQFTNSILVTVAVYTNSASLIHRYSFDEDASASMAADSIGGSDWDGTLNGGAAFSGTGQLILDGYSGFVQLPAGILTNLDAVTIETWASFGTISNWAVLFTFGDSDGTYGHNYISCQPHTGAATAQTGIKNATAEQNPWFTPVLDNYTNVQIVAVYHPEAGFCSIYTNGVLASLNSAITITMADAMATGDPLNYIGHSLYSADPYLPAYIEEFRIYQGPMTASQVMADYALGPNQIVGTSTSTSLAAAVASGNLKLRWPTNSALVTLLASPSIGPGAAWTPTVVPLTIVGGQYQAMIPLSSTAQYFRLGK